MKNHPYKKIILTVAAILSTTLVFIHNPFSGYITDDLYSCRASWDALNINLPICSNSSGHLQEFRVERNNILQWESRAPLIQWLSTIGALLYILLFVTTITSILLFSMTRRSYVLPHSYKESAQHNRSLAHSQEISYVKSWLLFFLIASVLGALVGMIIGIILSTIGISIISGITATILQFIIGIPISFLTFKWSVRKYIVDTLKITAIQQQPEEETTL